MSLDKLNTDVQQKTKQFVARLKAEQNALGMKHGSDSLQKIGSRISTKNQVPNRVRIRFKKSGIFVHKGVGRGTPAALAGTTNRKAKEWFNPLVEEFADELMETFADAFIDVSYEKLKIK
jgi:prophage DNA circulation protein